MLTVWCWQCSARRAEHFGLLLTVIGATWNFGPQIAYSTCLLWRQNFSEHVGVNFSVIGEPLFLAKNCWRTLVSCCYYGVKCWRRLMLTCDFAYVWFVWFILSMRSIFICFVCFVVWIVVCIVVTMMTCATSICLRGSYVGDEDGSKVLAVRFFESHVVASKSWTSHLDIVLW